MQFIKNCNNTNWPRGVCTRVRSWSSTWRFLATKLGVHVPKPSSSIDLWTSFGTPRGHRSRELSCQCIVSCWTAKKHPFLHLHFTLFLVLRRRDVQSTARLGDPCPRVLKSFMDKFSEEPLHSSTHAGFKLIGIPHLLFWIFKFSCSNYNQLKQHTFNLCTFFIRLQSQCQGRGEYSNKN